MSTKRKEIKILCEGVAVSNLLRLKMFTKIFSQILLFDLFSRSEQRLIEL